MTHKSFILSSLFQVFLKRINFFLKLVRKTNKKNRKIFERFQLTFIYFFAIVVLAYSIRNSLGYFPEALSFILPFFTPLFEIQALKILAAPEKTFLLYMLILEMCINRSYLNFSLLVKFNILLIFLLEMLQNLLISFWDLLFNRELDILRGGMVVIAKNATITFYSILFLFFFSLYMYAYILSLKGQIPTFPGILKNVTESVAFWLQIKRSNEQKKKK